VSFSNSSKDEWKSFQGQIVNRPRTNTNPSKDELHIVQGQIEHRQWKGWEATENDSADAANLDDPMDYLRVLVPSGLRARILSKFAAWRK
jgi:hypothetical protein